MAFAPTLICKGYTSEGRLAIGDAPYRRVLLDEYSATFERNAMRSEGVRDFAQSVTQVRRHSGAWLMDVPTISASIGFDTTAPLLLALCAALRTGRNSAVKLEIRDDSAGIEWKFNECYMKDVAFGGDEHTVVKPSLDLLIPGDEINYEWTKRTLIRTGETGLGTGVGNERFVDMVPYWMWEIDIDGVRRNDLEKFDFKFSQTIKQKFECKGEDSPSRAVYLLFGLPEITFGATEIWASKGNAKYNEAVTQMRDAAALASHTITIGTAATGRLLTMTGAYETRATPALVAASDFPTLNHSWAIAGELK